MRWLEIVPGSPTSTPSTVGWWRPNTGELVPSWRRSSPWATAGSAYGGRCIRGHSHQPGVLINGFYESWPIQYRRRHAGSPQPGNHRLAPDHPLRLAINAETIDFDDADISGWERRLDPPGLLIPPGHAAVWCRRGPG